MLRRLVRVKVHCDFRERAKVTRRCREIVVIEPSGKGLYTYDIVAQLL
jgi:hypothetical protein